LTHLEWKISKSLCCCALCVFLLFLFSRYHYQAVARIVLRMPSSAIIGLPTCLRWPRSGNKLDLLSFVAQTCTLKLEVVMTPLPIMLMPQIASKR